jgi:predicted small metal-binding protein
LFVGLDLGAVADQIQVGGREYRINRQQFSNRTQIRKEDVMREFQCGTLVPGCDWKTAAGDDAEVVRRAVEHLRTAHGEASVRQNMVENIKGRIREVAGSS